MRIWPTVRNIAVLLVLLATSITGLLDAAESAGYTSTRTQGIAVVAQLVYALLGLLGFFGVVLKARGTVWVLVLWAVAASATAGLASVGWGGTGLGAGLAAAGGAALVTAFIVWAGARAVARAGTGKGHELAD